ncbi:hypothetical protein B0H67DRAFT_646945 [Lasiosphaeris hirsuta]|uniref:DUF4484 domain-containing protein n=1 Tax=Lasiosphaeris hirsuta TaxID=260670 RepID=A0AA40A989_9PEZI|nr:hypothetical protein B0H67DRAFT_646945 [Lasiosphaeris hirsuta]
MAASRRGQPPLSVRLPQPAAPTMLPDLPPISALFLIDFDVKAGYTIVWKQAVPGLELEGIVEYKSLPSGLHTVPDDLVYFVHDNGHAGLSAFVNERTDEAESRHARMIAVGVLVPLSYGRLGRAWRHAPALKEMASALATDRKQTQLLEQYWERNGARETSAPQPLKPLSETPVCSPSLSFRAGRPGQGNGHSRNRSASDGAALIPPGHRLSPFHPAWSLTALLDTFGPLIFPIHRAALLRKRIMISTHAPVHEACNFVYDISVLSNIPLSVCDIIDPCASVQRLRPLFTIGVHDISYLVEHQAALRRARSADDDSAVADEATSGWVACTTDSILAVKENLWDMLVTMPPPYSSDAKERVWPTVECPKGVSIKATQRDLRRFRSLKIGLARLAAFSTSMQSQPQNSHSPRSEATDASAPTASGIRLARSPTRPSTSPEDGAAATRRGLGLLGDDGDDDTEKIVEPTTWAALAYSGFMWWASAGEQRRSDEVDELAHDGALLAELAPPMPMGMPTAQQLQRRASFNLAPPPVTGASLVDSVSSLTAKRASTNGEGEGDDEDEARVELAIIAYFHRLTTSMLGVLADIVDSSDEDDLLDIDFDPTIASAGGDDDGSGDEARLLPRLRDGDGDGGGGWVRVDSEALANMGLDVWSQGDADFVKELTGRYFGRRAYVEMKGVEVCGLRVC